jgi:hypothetical protein
MSTPESPDRQDSPDRKDQELPENWRKQSSEPPPPEPQKAEQAMLSGCGITLLIVFAIFGLVFGSCYLGMR